MAAFWFGILSAISLPLGAWVGIWTRPKERITAAIMAYGGGALLAALTLELVHDALKHGGFWPLATGCVAGGLAFAFLNQLLNHQGGFLRKTTTLMKHLKILKRRKTAATLEHLSTIQILRLLPPSEIHGLVPYIRERKFPAGSRLIAEGDPGDEIYFVEAGKIEVIQGGRPVAELGPGEVFGEMALLTDEKRSATVLAKTDVDVLELHKQDFGRLMASSPKLAGDFQRLVESRKSANQISGQPMDMETWATQAKSHATSSTVHVTSADVKEAIATHAQGGAPMAIWLGIFLDGIPESAVIGASLVGESKVSAALIAGLFLANFPESMSSSVGMKKMGMSTMKISWLWGSLCIMTGVGAYFGNILFQTATPQMLALFEGLAAGAMLAMIAETMIPEAFQEGGSVVGMSTILGFLSAIFVKTLER